MKRANGKKMLGWMRIWVCLFTALLFTLACSESIPIQGQDGGSESTIVDSFSFGKAECRIDKDCHDKGRTHAKCQDGVCKCVYVMDLCGSSCVYFDSNPNHCGACNNKCTGVTNHCLNGKCACHPKLGNRVCEGSCVHTTSNPEHCGECGKKCSMPGSICSAGKCVCPKGQVVCGGRCVDLKRDVEHCGTCGTKCLHQKICTTGECACSVDKSVCGKECVDLRTNNKHCGSCGNTCSTRKNCRFGQCFESCSSGNCIEDIQAGHGFSCMLKTDGSVWCWGFNQVGQLGRSTAKNVQSKPVRVLEIEKITTLSAGNTTVCSLKKDGSVWCWGDKSFKQSTARLMKGITGIAQFSIGNSHNCAVRKDGVAWCWGHNNFGQLNRWGTMELSFPPRTPVRSMEKVKMASVGDNRTCVIKQDDKVWCWGYGYGGHMGHGKVVPKTNVRIRPVQVKNAEGTTYIELNSAHSCLLKKDGSVWCWGYNNMGGLGDGTRINRNEPVQVKNLQNVKQISLGYKYSCALKENGSVWCWGGGSFGQLGNGEFSLKESPVKVKGLTKVKRISVGFRHACALKEDATLWCWGDNSYTQLGIADKKSKSVPVQVAF